MELKDAWPGSGHSTSCHLRDVAYSIIHHTPIQQGEIAEEKRGNGECGEGAAVKKQKDGEHSGRRGEQKSGLDRTGGWHQRLLGGE